MATHLIPLFDAWSADDVEGIKRLLADDVEARTPWSRERTVRGRDAVAAQMLSRKQTFSSLTIEGALIGVGCVTYLIRTGEQMLIAATFVMNADHKVANILICVDAEVSMRREIFRRGGTAS